MLLWLTLEKSKTGRAGVFAYVFPMVTLPVAKARAPLYSLIDQAASSHQPIQITGKRANAVLISAEDWSAIQETLYLLSVPGMRGSIKKGMSTPVDQCCTLLWTHYQ